MISYILFFFVKVTTESVKKQDSEFEPGSCSKVKFEENEIHLKIPDSTIYGWKMSQINQLVVCTTKYCYC